MSTWEERMSQRAKARTSPSLASRRRVALQGREAYVAAMFIRYYEPGDPDEILPEILAARCLGIKYGDPGPELEPEWCRECWGDRHVWLGNAWGLQHVRPGPEPAPGRMHDCRHACHEGEIWMAASA